MTLEFILLSMLRLPASGYDLKKAFDEGPRHFWSAELSQIYPTLQRMEKRGWLTSARKASPRGPARRVYRRTAAGVRALHGWFRAGPVMGAERFAYIAQLTYMGELGQCDLTLRFLEQLRARLDAFAKLLAGAEQDLLDRGGRSGERLDDQEFHELLSLRIGIRSLKAKVAACDENMRLVRARSPRVRRDGEVRHAPS